MWSQANQGPRMPQQQQVRGQIPPPHGQGPPQQQPGMPQGAVMVQPGQGQLQPGQGQPPRGQGQFQVIRIQQPSSGASQGSTAVHTNMPRMVQPHRGVQYRMAVGRPIRPGAPNQMAQLHPIRPAMGLAGPLQDGQFRPNNPNAPPSAGQMGVRANGPVMGPQGQIMGPNGPQNVGPHGQMMGPNGPQNVGPSGQIMGPNGPQNLGPNGQIMGPNGPQNVGPNGQIMGPNGPQNLGPNGQIMGPNGPQNLGPNGQIMGPAMQSMGPNGPENIGPNGPQHMGPKGPESGGPHMPTSSAENDQQSQGTNNLDNNENPGGASATSQNMQTQDSGNNNMQKHDTKAEDKSEISEQTHAEDTTVHKEKESGESKSRPDGVQDKDQKVPLFPGQPGPNHPVPSNQDPNLQGPNHPGPNIPGPNNQGPNQQGPNHPGPNGPQNMDHFRHPFMQSGMGMHGPPGMQGPQGLQAMQGQYRFPGMMPGGGMAPGGMPPQPPGGMRPGMPDMGAGGEHLPHSRALMMLQNMRQRGGQGPQQGMGEPGAMQQTPQLPSPSQGQNQPPAVSQQQQHLQQQQQHKHGEDGTTTDSDQGSKSHDDAENSESEEEKSSDELSGSESGSPKKSSQSGGAKDGQDGLGTSGARHPNMNLHHRGYPGMPPTSMVGPQGGMGHPGLPPHIGYPGMAPHMQHPGAPPTSSGQPVPFGANRGQYSMHMNMMRPGGPQGMRHAMGPGHAEAGMPPNPHMLHPQGQPLGSPNAGSQKGMPPSMSQPPVVSREQEQRKTPSSEHSRDSASPMGTVAPPTQRVSEAQPHARSTSSPSSMKRAQLGVPDGRNLHLQGPPPGGHHPRFPPGQNPPMQAGFPPGYGYQLIRCIGPDGQVQLRTAMLPQHAPGQPPQGSPGQQYPGQPQQQHHPGAYPQGLMSGPSGHPGLPTQPSDSQTQGGREMAANSPAEGATKSDISGVDSPPVPETNTSISSTSHHLKGSQPKTESYASKTNEAFMNEFIDFDNKRTLDPREKNPMTLKRKEFASDSEEDQPPSKSQRQNEPPMIERESDGRAMESGDRKHPPAGPPKLWRPGVEENGQRMMNKDKDVKGETHSRLTPHESTLPHKNGIPDSLREGRSEHGHNRSPFEPLHSTPHNTASERSNLGYTELDSVTRDKPPMQRPGAVPNHPESSPVKTSHSNNNSRPSSAFSDVSTSSGGATHPPQTQQRFLNLDGGLDSMSKGGRIPVSSPQSFLDLDSLQQPRNAGSRGPSRGGQATNPLAMMSQMQALLPAPPPQGLPETQRREAAAARMGIMPPRGQHPMYHQYMQVSAYCIQL